MKIMKNSIKKGNSFKFFKKAMAINSLELAGIIIIVAIVLVILIFIIWPITIGSLKRFG